MASLVTIPPYRKQLLMELIDKTLLFQRRSMVDLLKKIKLLKNKIVTFILKFMWHDNQADAVNGKALAFIETENVQS